MTLTGGAPAGALPSGLGREELTVEVRRALRWVPEGALVGLGVSGGADSVSLAHLVVAARPDLASAVLHVRHGLRDDRQDAAAAAAAAATLGLPFEEIRVEVRPDRRTGLEAAARDARLDALERAARERGSTVVLLAHTADDQAETVLLNLGRGSGLAGLAGMAARRQHGTVTLARPLLRARRADVRGLAAVSGWRWVEDPMNEDPQRRRTRARLTLMPALDSLSGGTGDAVGLLTRLADLARDDVEVLEALAAEHVARDVVAWGPARAVPAEQLRALPVALARRVVRAVLAEVRGTRTGLPAAAVQAALRLAPDGAVDVAGGVRASRAAGWLVVAPVGAVTLPWRALPRSGHGVAELPELDLRVRVGATPGVGGTAAVVPPGISDGAAAREHAVGWLPGVFEAGLRGWRPGDRLRTVSGEVPLAAAMARAGVPAPLRPLVPVVVDAGDLPLWVPGVACVPVEGPDRRAVWLAPAQDGEHGAARGEEPAADLG